MTDQERMDNLCHDLARAATAAQVAAYEIKDGTVDRSAALRGLREAIGQQMKVMDWIRTFRESD